MINDDAKDFYWGGCRRLVGVSMLIVCNGAFKSGSTWLYCLLRFLSPRVDPLPPEFREEGEWNGETIRAGKLPDFLQQVDLKNRNYIFKSHYDSGRERDLLLAHPETVVFNIRRDLRDVIVSAYFHFKRLQNETRSFADYYWHAGRALIPYLKGFHDLWRPRPGKVYLSSYERLQADLEAEIRRIARLLKVKLSGEKMALMVRELSLDSLRERWHESDRPEQERFFRKGIVGDWKNHFSAEMLRDFYYLVRSPTAAAMVGITTDLQKQIDESRVAQADHLATAKRMADRVSELESANARQVRESAVAAEEYIQELRDRDRRSEELRQRIMEMESMLAAAAERLAGQVLEFDRETARRKLWENELERNMQSLSETHVVTLRRLEEALGERTRLNDRLESTRENHELVERQLVVSRSLLRQREAELLQSRNDLRRVKSGYSYRLGRGLLWPVRKMRLIWQNGHDGPRSDT
jgi:hypothetical protein